MKILVTSVGGSPALDTVRCLKEDPSVVVIGADASEPGLKLGAVVCDELRPVPRADRTPDAYVDALERLSAEVDLVFLTLDVEVEALVRTGRRPAKIVNVPPQESLAILLDKAKTEEVARDTGLFPATERVQGPEQLAEALARLPTARAWLRPSQGASGAGAIAVESAAEARAWMSFWTRRGVKGSWMLQEFLPGRNLNWTAIYERGRLVATAQMERLEYFLAAVAPGGVTGQVRRARTVDVPAAAAAAETVVRAICPEPHGMFSVDLREDERGQPRLNEINPRPAGRGWLMAKAGANLPLALARLRLGLPIGDAIAPGGCRPGLEFVRQMDLLPVFYDSPT
ncbi:MAG: ATP-grasp domain-containing protein [Myxococcales bacterium]|nr:ATP-grasp domain-containing protein [Myxococcales bacterium]MCB9754252.1 ATP-grasp domain-containing protein [Myxococcales bacterium]